VDRFSCPYCKNQVVWVAPLMVCPSCLGEMTFDNISKLEFRGKVKKQDYYLGVGEIHKNVRVVTPNGFQTELLSTESIRAIYPLRGLRRPQPLLFLYGDHRQLSVDHLQTDSLFRKLQRGLLYSAFLQLIIWILTNPPVWISFMFMGIWLVLYLYATRSLPARGKNREQGLAEQIKLQKKAREGLIA
jgi:hypothetical protein